jgi:hypothetical protein
MLDGVGVNLGMDGHGAWSSRRHCLSPHMGPMVRIVNHDGGESGCRS